MCQERSGLSFGLRRCSQCNVLDMLPTLNICHQYSNGNVKQTAVCELICLF